MAVLYETVMDEWMDELTDGQILIHTTFPIAATSPTATAAPSSTAVTLADTPTAAAVVTL